MKFLNLVQQQDSIKALNSLKLGLWGFNLTWTAHTLITGGFSFAGKHTQKKMLTDLKDDDEGQPGSQDMPELQGEFVRHWAPRRRSVVSVPAVSELAAVLRLPHVKHRQAAVHVASQTPEGGKEKLSDHNTSRMYLKLTHYI